MTPRATPMPAQERRAALIDATLPLLLKHGPSLTTRQVAEAADVAEGTIFRVFDSLSDLVEATALEAMSEQRLKNQLANLTLGESLREKCEAAVALFVSRFNDMRMLLMAVHGAGPHSHSECMREELGKRRHELDEWLTSRFADHADELAVTAADFVGFLRVIATGHALVTEDSPLGPERLVPLALNGALRKDR